MSKRGIIFITSLSVIAVLIVAITIVRFLFFELLAISGHSMSPTLRNGDRVLVYKWAYRSRKPDRGDIIAFSMDWERIIVKRIVGLPGDLIEVRNGLLYRDGELISNEPYVTFYPRDLRRRSYRPRIVKEGQLFVMGDNRVLSVDSKDFGPILYKDVIGKAVFIYFPFKRIGKPTPDEEET